VPLRGDPLEQRRRPDAVLGHVARDLVHRLTDPDLGGEVDDAVDAGEGAIDRVGVENGAVEILGLGVAVAGALTVHLGLERIEHAHAAPVGNQPVDQVGADEPGSAGDQDVSLARHQSAECKQGRRRAVARRLTSAPAPRSRAGRGCGRASAS
jgi:hypothetical protein